MSLRRVLIRVGGGGAILIFFEQYHKQMSLLYKEIIFPSSYTYCEFLNPMFISESGFKIVCTLLFYF